MIWDWHHRNAVDSPPTSNSSRRTNEWIHKKSDFSSPLIPQKESEPISSDGGFATPWARPEWNTITRLLELRGAHSFLWRASGANLPWIWIFRSPNFPKKKIITWPKRGRGPCGIIALRVELEREAHPSLSKQTRLMRTHRTFGMQGQLLCKVHLSSVLKEEKLWFNHLTSVLVRSSSSTTTSLQLGSCYS